MITSYNTNLPTPAQLTAVLSTNSNVETFNSSPTTETLLWEDGGGNEIRIIHDTTSNITLVLLYDNESNTNFYPDEPHRQTALNDAPDEIVDLIETVKPELLWSWDDTEQIWYTAAFWSTDNKNWQTSYDWEESHDEDSVSWMIETIENEIINS